MIENPEDIFQQIQNLVEKIAKVSLNHLSRLTALESRLTASPRHILEIFYTMRTDDGPINGAYDCDGSEFSADDFEGENNPYTMLVNGNAPVCTSPNYGGTSTNPPEVWVGKNTTTSFYAYTSSSALFDSSNRIFFNWIAIGCWK